VTKPVVLALVMSTAALASAAEPSAPPDAPSEELLEYLGTWNGDEEWLHSDDLLPPKQAVSPDPVNSQNEERAQPRDPAEQGK
jgi:hypothetical protein